jgi:ATP-dependent Clp protease ATP-binding subunit ClpA
VQRYVENPLSKAIISHEFAAGDNVRIDTDSQGLTFSKSAEAVAVAAEA